MLGCLPIIAAVLAAAEGRVPVSVEVLAPDGERIADARIVAQPRALPGSAVREPVEVAVHERVTRLELVPGVWSLWALAPERRSWPAEVLVRPGAAETERVTLALWATGRLTGSFDLTAGEILPNEIVLSVLHDVGPSDWTREPARHQVTCPVVDTFWVCEVPAGQSLNYRLETRRFAPHYLWDVIVQNAQRRDVGRARFYRGSSVSGWVVAENAAENAGLDSHRAHVHLKAPDGEEIAGHLDDSRLQTETDARGFFQIGPVPPGKYHVVASAGQRISHAQAITLERDAEERLSSPLVLKPPAELRVTIRPPLDPLGHPWGIRLYTWSGKHAHMVAHGEPVPEDGTWSRGGLPAGQYRLAVTTQNRGTWHTQEVDLESGVHNLEVDILMVRVYGSVSIGGEPLAGKVALAEGTAGVQAEFEADKKGRFEGYFPSVVLDGAHWKADVISYQPPVRRTFERVVPRSATSSELEFVFKLGGGTVEGIVVDESGSPQFAGVFLLPPLREEAGESGSALVDTRTSSSTGQFRITGLKEGQYRVYARSVKADDVVSDITPVSVGEDVGANVTLALKEATTVEGRVVAPLGNGIAGATVVVLPADVPDMLVRPVRTDAAGRFVAKVPRGTKEIVINIEAVGVARKTLGRAVPTDGALTVELNPVVGQLTLDMGDVNAGLSRFLVHHDGGFVPAQVLASWSARNGLPADVGSGTMQVPLMVPGRYRFCRLLGYDEYFALMAGTLPAGQCDEGDLPPGGSLLLRAPKQGAKAPMDQTK